MFAPDPKTLSLAIGLANITFALLASVYIANSRTGHAALEMWRWGRLAAGSGFLVNLAAGTTLLPIPAVLGNLLQTLGGGLDIAAYCMLLDRERWRRPLATLVATTLLVLTLISVAVAGQSLRLLVFSAFGVVYYAIMAKLMLRTGHPDWLRRVIGWCDMAMAVLLLLRTLRGLAFAPLVRFDTDAITLAMYIALFVMSIVNGFGFLLIARRKDDQLIYRALDELERQGDQDQPWRDFLALAAHEFRTPAAQIKMSLDSLRIQGDTIPPEVERRLDNVRRAAQRLVNLSNTLLTRERLGDPEAFGERREIDLVALIRDVAGAYPPEAHVGTSVPDEPLIVYGDPLQLRIALHNLADNAIEHTAGCAGPIVVFATKADTSLEFGIADVGPGIPDADKPRLFDKFHSPRGHFMRGLGLAIVASVARNHGGEARVRDNVPRGTVMFIRLPRDTGQQREE